ncbi:hypothetical protein BDZ97DRAFT_686807 [Flammula alnicola]|nr:hypothetical protein BDZ97DRAFT_686807 [Flammula alnicola]
MVFSNLQSHEKDAFFSLLDEYFSSRPEIFSNNAAQSDGQSAQSTQDAAVSAVQRAMVNNPEATARVMSAGLRHVANSRTGAGAGGSGASADPGVSDNEVNSVAGRVAAASLAFSARNSHVPSSSISSPPPIAEKPSSNLVSAKKFGSVDTSSTMGFIGSLRSKPPSSPPQVAAPPAFAPRQNTFAPPPVRRAGSAPEPEEEEQEAGEWADALYDYESGEAGDLKITEGERVLVTERTSDDWWTGEVNGKKGLFPASYVKLL